MDKKGYVERLRHAALLSKKSSDYWPVISSLIDLKGYPPEVLDKCIGRNFKVQNPLDLNYPNRIRFSRQSIVELRAGILEDANRFINNLEDDFLPLVFRGSADYTVTAAEQCIQNLTAQNQKTQVKSPGFLSYLPNLASLK